ncbi:MULTISPECIES: lipopolysaccharide kinase InaA family protein [Alcanivorax]|uniref:lipopolysaccharide kinase InaA family protein n=1 Tax=Alcanivorax TaxID=59753 RepID=UPI0025B8AC78|nr:MULTISPECIES: lipopolysaccharide kinase InaA family protein [Alcanivorax]
MADSSQDITQALLASRETVLPVTLSVDGQVLEMQSLLRFMPERRAVYSGLLDGQPVIIKLFSSHPRSRREVQVEQQRLTALAEKQVPAPRVLLRDYPGESALLVLEHLGEASAKARLQEISAEKIPGLVQELVVLTSKMHRHGVMQNDIHLGNFIFADGAWHVIDAGDVEVTDAPVEKSKALGNLALLLAQFPPLSLPTAQQVVSAYGDTFSSQQLAESLKKTRHARLRKLVKKSLRNCTEFVELNGKGYTGMGRREDQPLIDALLNTGLDTLLENCERLKDGNSATVGRVQIQGESLVIKRYNVKSAWKKLARQFKSRARNSWLNATYLGLVQIPTPRAVCYLSSKQSGLTDREYLVCRNVEGRMLPEICEAGGPLRDQALSQMADFFAVMRLMAFSHGDSKYTNFLFQDGQLQVLDLDGMSRDPGRGLEQELADQRQRLFESWRPREALAPQARQEFNAFYEARIKSIESWL